MTDITSTTGVSGTSATTSVDTGAPTESVDADVTAKMDDLMNAESLTPEQEAYNAIFNMLDSSVKSSIVSVLNQSTNIEPPEGFGDEES